MKRACRPRQMVSRPSLAVTSKIAARPFSSASVAVIETGQITLAGSGAELLASEKVQAAYLGL